MSGNRAYGFQFYDIGFRHIFGFMKTIEHLNIKLENDLAVISGIFIFIFIIGNLWWRFVAKLKEPSWG